MKHVFLASFAIMVLLSGVAWLGRPHRLDIDREIVWVCDDNPVRREQIDLFNKLYPQYHLSLDPVNVNLGAEKTIVQSLAGVGPDVFDCYTGFQLAAYVRSGVALDCTEALRSRGIDIDETWPALFPLTVHEGRVYGLPGNGGANAMWYNKKLFEEAGLPYPTGDWTWRDFLAIAQKLTRRDERGRPIQFGMMMSPEDWLDILVAQWGGSVYNKEGTRSALDSPEACEAMQFYHDLIHKYQVVPTPAEELAVASAGGWGQGIIAQFGADKTAMAIGGRWWLCLLRRDDFEQLRAGVVEVPAGPSRRIFAIGRSSLINSKSRNIEGALTFLEYLYGPYWNSLVNRQADALAPVMKYNYTDDFLFNPEHPEEDYNAVWRKAMEDAAAREFSPYVNGTAVDRIIRKQGDLVRSNTKTGADAMRDAARQINKAIIEQLKIDPELRERYHAELATGAQPAWDDPKEAP